MYVLHTLTNGGHYTAESTLYNIILFVSTLYIHVQWLGSHESLATSCDFQHSEQPNVVVVGLEDGYYHIWDTRTKQPVKTVNGN